MSNRTKWLMLFVLSFILVFVVWKYYGPSIARAANIDTAAIKMPHIKIPYITADDDAAEAESPVHWLTDIDAGIASCRESGKAVLIVFTEPDNDACKQLRNDALNGETIAPFLADRFIAVRIEHNEANSATARKFGIHSVPTLVVYGPDGKHADTLVGLPPVPKDGKLETQIHKWLKEAFAKSWGI